MTNMFMITLQSFSAFTAAISELSIASGLYYYITTIYSFFTLMTWDDHKCFMPHSLQEWPIRSKGNAAAGWFAKIPETAQKIENLHWCRKRKKIRSQILRQAGMIPHICVCKKKSQYIYYIYIYKYIYINACTNPASMMNVNPLLGVRSTSAKCLILQFDGYSNVHKSQSTTGHLLNLGWHPLALILDSRHFYTIICLVRVSNAS